MFWSLWGLLAVKGLTITTVFFLDHKQLSYLESASNNVKRAFDFCVRTLFLQMFVNLENEGTISACTKTFAILFDSFSGNTTSFYITLTRPLCFD